MHSPKRSSGSTENAKPLEFLKNSKKEKDDLEADLNQMSKELLPEDATPELLGAFMTGLK